MDHFSPEDEVLDQSFAQRRSTLADADSSHGDDGEASSSASSQTNDNVDLTGWELLLCEKRKRTTPRYREAIQMSQLRAKAQEQILKDCNSRLAELCDALADETGREDYSVSDQLKSLWREVWNECLERRGDLIGESGKRKGLIR